MPFNLASALLLIAVVCAILPPGDLAYIGAYISLAAGLVSLVIYPWRHGAGLLHPVSLAIVVALALVAATVPFTYRGEEDLLGILFILPMLTAVALGLLAVPAKWIPGATLIGLVGLIAAVLALSAGAVEYVLFDVRRVGLGNNPIHYASLAAMAGGLALVGAAAGTSPWRYLFLLGPIAGLGATLLSGSRGPMVSAVAIAAVGMGLLLVWHWGDKLFRYSVLAAVIVGGITVATLIDTGSGRLSEIFETGLDIFHFTGGRDDIRAALYSSAIETWRSSPIVGVGLGQIMDMAQMLYPEQEQAFSLDNLHADWANFAAMAGSMGLLAWLLLLTAPLMLLLDPAVRADRPTVLGAIVLFTAQLTLGVSNATFGVLPQTIIYAVALGYFLVRARRLSLPPATP